MLNQILNTNDIKWKFVSKRKKEGSIQPTCGIIDPERVLVCPTTAQHVNSSWTHHVIQTKVRVSYACFFPTYMIPTWLMKIQQTTSLMALAGEMFEANISSVVRVNADYTSPRNQTLCWIMGSRENFRLVTPLKLPATRSSWGSKLRKAVRRTDSLLFATEGRIGCGGRASFLWPQSRRAPGRRVFRRSCFQAHVPWRDLMTVGYRFPRGPSGRVGLERGSGRMFGLGLV